MLLDCISLCSLHLFSAHFIQQVEFPEARIYEETLNVLLYENRTGPDAELMQATSTRGAVAPVVCTSDDEEERRGGACSQSGLGRLRSNKNN